MAIADGSRGRTVPKRLAAIWHLPKDRLFRKLQVAGKVEPDYWVRPLIVDFEKVDHEQAVKKRIRLRTHRMPDAQITRVESQHPAFTARLLEERTAEGEQQVEVTFSGRDLTARGTVDSRITVYTNSPRRPSLDQLNGRPGVSLRCRQARHVYKSDPSREHREALRRAYEAVPEHQRHYCGKQIRRILSSDGGEDGAE